MNNLDYIIPKKSSEVLRRRQEIYNIRKYNVRKIVDSLMNPCISTGVIAKTNQIKSMPFKGPHKNDMETTTEGLKMKVQQAKELIREKGECFQSQQQTLFAKCEKKRCAFTSNHDDVLRYVDGCVKECRLNAELRYLEVTQ